MKKNETKIRINKYLAECGLGSRRAVEQIVLDGRVKINNRPIKLLSETVEPKKDKVSVDDKKVAPINRHIYLALHKPKGCVTTTQDELNRKTVLDYVPKKYREKRIFPVGRLDYDTEGLVLLLTDGDAANRITHPKYELSKTYQVKLEQEVSEKELDRLRAGIELDGEYTKPCKIKMLPSELENRPRVEITLQEGRNRQVRRMFEAIGKTVIFLKRVAIGVVRLGGLGRGEVRELTEGEVASLSR